MSKKKNTLLRNTSILMAATIISRVIGLLYRSPLGETIGNEGLGYYSTASNLYTILLLISSYSIPMAVSKIVSERLALKEYRNAHRVFHGALIYAVIVGGIAALVAFSAENSFCRITSRMHSLPYAYWRRPSFSRLFSVFCAVISRPTAR